jgi:hypothetical protein
VRDLTGPPNKSMAKIDVELVVTWKGAMIFYGKLRHLDTTDFHHIVDGLRMEHRKYPQDPGLQNVNGVRINFAGVVEICREATEPCKVNQDFITAVQRQSLPIGDKVGIPLVYGNIEYALAWRDRKTRGHGGPQQYAINTMLMVMDPKLFIRGSSTVLVAWKDARPLHPAHIEALYGYVDGLALKHSVPWLSGDMSLEEGTALFAKREEILLGNASEAGFRQYWRLCWKGNRRLRFSGAASPYDV